MSTICKNVRNTKNQHLKEISNTNETKKEIVKLKNCLKADKVLINIFAAVQQQDTKAIERHIKNGVNLKKKNLQGFNPLHMAAQIGDSLLVDLFVAEGVGVNLLAKWKRTALYIAVEQQHIHIAKQLLEYGAKINTQTKNGDSPLHEATRLGNFDLVKLLLDHGADPNIMNEARISPFLLSWTDATDDRLIKLFFEYDINVCQKNDMGENALHLAARFGSSDIVQMLLKMQLNPNEMSYAGWTPLRYTVSDNNFLDNRLAIIQTLVKYGCDIELEDKYGKTPLFRAAEDKNSAMMKSLVELGAQVNHIARNGSTPLICALKMSNVSAIHYLLEHGANAQGKDVEGDGVLHIAIRSLADSTIRYQVVEALLARGASINERDVDRATALHLSLLDRDVKLFDLLIKSGANIHVKDSRNRSIVQVAVCRDLEQVVLKLLAMGANPNDYDCEGNGLLANAIHLNNERMVRFLLKYGAHPNRKRAVHVAAERGRVQMMKILVNHGADINYTRKRELTPLHKAIAFEQYQMVQYLLDKGANVNTANKSNLPLRNAITSFTVKMTNINFNYIVVIMIKHIALLLARDQYVHEENIHLIRKQNFINNEFNTYSEELADMKKMKIKGTNVSFFDLLNKKNDALIDCVRPKIVREAVHSQVHRQLFPNFSKYLENNCLPAMNRLNLIGVVLTSMHTIFQPVLPCEITKIIVEKLSTNDLKKYKTLAKLA